MRGGSSDGSVPHRPFHTMAEAEKARVKLAKQDQKEANELLVAVQIPATSLASLPHQ